MSVLLGSAVVTVVESDRAFAADPTTFDAGRIIDDAVFYDSSRMSEASVQQFIDSKQACAASPGNPGCLESYRTSTADRAADKYCAAYRGGSNELASTILHRVAVACGVNPQVLLATLEKEQGLITSRDPSATKYLIAMGFGCPDTAACDTKYYGFGNQVYAAARQFKVYPANPSIFRYQAGRTVAIQWHPDAACGASNVTIQNNATAALYNYTPYRPNQAAMSNLSGRGDDCSAYGNRNFWRNFTDWFGSTTVPRQASAFVRALYADVLKREASASEVNGWGLAVASGLAPVDAAAGFVNGDEYRLTRINAAYSTILGRPAEAGGAASWLANMKRGVLQTDDIDKIFLGTDEFLLRSGNTNELFVNALYERLIGRSAAPNERSGWSAVASASGRNVVVDTIWRSTETAKSRVSTMYADYLGRPPAANEVDGWAQLAINNGDAGVRWAIIGSAEYWVRASNRFPKG
jgi:hypothetical protein